MSNPNRTYTMEELLNVVLMDDHPDEWKRLLHMRGGCRCCVSPPCSACVDPIDEDEAIKLGLLATSPEPDLAVDYMKHVRDLCRGI